MVEIQGDLYLNNFVRARPSQSAMPEAEKPVRSSETPRTSTGLQSPLSNTRAVLDVQERHIKEKEDIKAARKSEEQEGKSPLVAPEDKELKPQDEALVRKLEARDKEVRDHERAHASAGAALASAPSYEMMVGPDGHKYAVGGEVKINLVKAKSPEDTIEKMEKVIKAALAPIRPSAGDRRVAEEARQIQMEAKIEIAREKAEERKEKIDEHKEERPMPTSANSDFTSRAMNAYDQAAELKSEKGQTHSQNAEL